MTNAARALQQVQSALGSTRGEGGAATVAATGESVGEAGATAEVAGAVVREKAAAEAVVGTAGAGVVPGVEAGGRPEVGTGVRLVVGAGAGAVGGVRVVNVKSVRVQRVRGAVVRARVPGAGVGAVAGPRVGPVAGAGVGPVAGAVGGAGVGAVTRAGVGPLAGAGVEPVAGAGTGAVTVVNSKLPTPKPVPAMATAPSQPKTSPAVPKLLPLLKLWSMPNQLTLPKPRPLSPPHDIKVEFLEDAPEGRQLSIAGGSLLQPSVLEMSQVILFAREVLAIPQLHSKEASLQAKIDELWPQIAKKYKMPGELHSWGLVTLSYLHLTCFYLENVCRALFAYLAGNLSVLPRIAPTTQLMCPLRSKLQVWEKSQRLFSEFNERASKYDGVKPQLPELLQHFQRYEHLYWKLRRPQPDDPAGPLQPPRHYTTEERAEVWRVAQERFPDSK